MNNVLNTVIRLRRDTEANYKLVENTLIPFSGEVCLVVTSKGIRVKVGDGEKTFAQLDYISYNTEIVFRGYYLNNKFYSDSTYTTELEKNQNAVYIDENSKQAYSYNGSGFDLVVAQATSTSAGVMKLYGVSGQNEDGTMTQKSITNGVSDIKFAVDENDAECLVLHLPW